MDRKFIFKNFHVKYLFFYVVISLLFYIVYQFTHISILLPMSLYFLFSFLISILTRYIHCKKNVNVDASFHNASELKEIDKKKRNICIKKIKALKEIIKQKSNKIFMNQWCNRKVYLFFLLIGIIFSYLSYNLLNGYTSSFSSNSRINLIIGFACIMVSPILRSKDTCKSFYYLKTFDKFGYWMLIISGMMLVLHNLKMWIIEPYIGKGISIVLFILSIETFLKGIFAFVKGEYNKPYLLLNMLFYGSNPLDSIVIFLEKLYGVNIKSSSELLLFKKIMMAIMLLALIGSWLSTSFVMIDITENGVVERFGKVKKNKVLAPGVHIVCPWPIDRVYKVDVSRIKSISIGIEEEKKGASLLWTKQHAQKEYNLLLGNGRDLITFNGKLEYKIDDPFAYLYHSQNPEEIIKQIAYRVLLKETVDKSLDEVLTESAKTLVDRITEKIHQEIEKQCIGIEVVAFRLQNLHPPMELARDYQKIISAQIYKKTRVIDAQTYKIRKIGDANIQALTNEKSAYMKQKKKKAEAKGETIQFQNRLKAYYANPMLYKFRKRLEKLEEVLIDKKIYIIDDRLNIDNKNLWIDLRQNGN